MDINKFAERAQEILASAQSIAMATYILKETFEKGYGVVAALGIKQDELIFHVDLNNFRKYTLIELECAVAENPEMDGDHANYVGHGKYVIEDTPASYMNHSCEPNCYIKMTSIAVYDVYALRSVAEGEELTHDYTASSVDQFAGQGFWVLECQCGSKNCRGKVTGDFFEMPEEWQTKFYRYLPPSIRRRYKEQFQLLRSKTDRL